MTRRIGVRKLLGSFAVLLAACGGSGDCSPIGCPFGYVASVTVHAPADLTGVTEGELVVCVGDRCKSAAFQFGGPGVVETISVVGDDGDEVRAELTMPDGSRFTGLGELADYRPNGDCGQTCTGTDLTLAAT